MFEALVEAVDERENRGSLGLQDLARDGDVRSRDFHHARAPAELGTDAEWGMAGCCASE
jgi:hypothetical protein